MAIASAGLLVHRSGPDGPEVLLAHPGGPFWRGRDVAAWSIPKGLPEPGETLEAAALREFREETGLSPPRPEIALRPVRSGGKIVHCWMAAADLDLTGFRSGLFELEWPRGSGRTALFPEVDAVAWFGRADALVRIHAGQRPILEEAFARLRSIP
ncbi:NUDIX domain-containing protein [Brevundimonas sp.]|uniref:NUDIX domain-containing protein n=1 Tax=Brevundimonas sp. TaxID=1871086 RepID=UPI0035B0264F